MIATATATATTMATVSATTTEMAMAMAMATATARVTITKEGLPLHVVAMCSAFGGATSTPMDTNKSACVMGVTLLSVFVCVFLASGYKWVTVMHEIPISSA